jgi:hypothetical protein
MTIDIASFAVQVPSPLPRAAELQWIDLSLRTAYAACRSNPCGISSEWEAAAQAAGQSRRGPAYRLWMADNPARADTVVGPPVDTAVGAFPVGALGTAMNLPVDKVLEMNEHMSARHDLGLRFR